MSVSPEEVLAYVDNQLSDADRAKFEAALAADASLRVRVDRERALQSRLSAAFDPTLSEALPKRLVTAAQSADLGNVVALPTKRLGWSYREWGAMAASLAGGLIIGLGAMSTQPSSFANSADGLIARGALAHALETQTADATDGAVRIGVSFRAHDGAYCRSFDMGGQRLAGLACKQGEAWRIPMTATIAAPQGEIRTAGSDTPAPILQAVDQMIDGDALDAKGERAALNAHWRPTP